MGYEDPISTNPAMVLGGLTLGVTPVGWTYAYSTIGNNGDRVSGTLAPRPGDSPVSYTQVTDKDGKTIKGGDNDSTPQAGARPGHRRRGEEHPRNRRLQRHRHPRPDRRRRRVGQDRHDRRRRSTPGSAVASADEVTACVWVGYPDSATSMTTLYNGGPVMGGTFPALIWASVISAWEEIKAENLAAKKKAKEKEGREAEESRPKQRNRIRAGGSRRSEETYEAKKKPKCAKPP